MRLVLLFSLFAPGLTAAYSNLIATSDGNAVYFQVKTSPVASSWFVAQSTVVSAVSIPLVDIDGSGSITAAAQTLNRICGVAGSTCFLADSCEATFTITGPGIHYSNPNSTFTRLSRSGKYIWIDQHVCWNLPPPPAFNITPLRGLYDAATLQLIAAEQGITRLATAQYGRRAVTDSGRALVLNGPQLAWLDAGGTHLIRNVNGAAEAVTDPSGIAVVYQEPGSGELHWLSGPDWLGARDLDLGVAGSAPAITDDGTKLLFLASDGSLQLYDHGSGATRRVGGDFYQSFAIGGSAVFAVALDGRLLRLDPASGASSLQLPAFPDITAVGALDVQPNFCTFICYGDTDYGKQISPGMLVTLDGKALGATGWHARSSGVDTEIHPLSDTEAWFQTPKELAAGGPLGPLEIYRDDFPIRWTMNVSVQNQQTVCLGTLHQDFSRVVSTSDPAGVGEVVHVFLTGLRGVESVPDGVPNPIDRLIPVANPPALADPAALEQLFFGLAPGLVGMQQLDVRIHGPAAGIFQMPSLNCAIPVGPG